MSETVPFRATDPYDWAEILALITQAFSGMAGRIDPPSSARHLTAASLAETARNAEVWVIGRPPIACMILTPKPDCLYLGKLAVDPGHQHKGLARSLVAHAEQRGKALGLPRLDLETRVELTENHATFRALGFTETARKAHPGYDRATSITFSKSL